MYVILICGISACSGQQRRPGEARGRWEGFANGRKKSGLLTLTAVSNIFHITRNPEEGVGGNMDGTGHAEEVSDANEDLSLDSEERSPVLQRSKGLGGICFVTGGPCAEIGYLGDAISTQSFGRAPPPPVPCDGPYSLIWDSPLFPYRRTQSP